MKIILGNSLEKLKKLKDNSIDSIVTDPPYELGFMGKKWDNTGIAYNVDLWAECLRVLKPGGHLLAFSGTRTYHRMAVAIEDAGFEVRDMIEWVYGSGFSKCTVWKEGAKRSSASLNKENDLMVENGWDGWGRGGLKPSHEPICMARKPLSEKTVAENCLKWGVGGINIDESRVESSQDDKEMLNAKSSKNPTGVKSAFGGGIASRAHEQGRFPANLIHDNSEEVRECFPESNSGNGKANTYEKFGGQWGKGKQIRNEDYGDSGNASRFFKSIIYNPKASGTERNQGLDKLVLVDIMEVLNNNTTLCEKSLIKEVKLAQLLVGMEQSGFTVTAVSGTQNKSVTEWSIGLFGKDTTEKYQEDYKSIILMETHSIMPLKIYKWLIHLLTNGYIQDVSLETTTGGNLVGSAENYSELTITISEKMALALGVKNAQSPTRLKISVKKGKSGHPTVKPIALMEYLIKMVTPKGGTVLDPFMGSGSTGVAAKKNGYDFIGIDMTPEYIEIAKARINATEIENRLL